MKSAIQIAHRRIGPDEPPFIIAEMSGNHNHELDRAFAIVEAAAKAGVHALKIQTYTADTMTLNLREGAFMINDPESLWYGSSLYELYEKAHTPWDWHAPIIKRCQELGLICFSSPFDKTAVDFLENLNMPCYKIASFENTDLALIEAVARTGKPMIISTGMATLEELSETVQTARNAGCRDLILLKCTSAYPTSPKKANLLTLPHMRDTFQVQVGQTQGGQIQVGLSDHTLGIGVAVAAVAQGATVIEKHFTLDRSEGGVDAAFSMEPHEMAQLVVETQRAWESLGGVQYGPTEVEEGSLVFRRSLYIVEDMQAGEKLTEKNLRAIRPGYGLPPRHYQEVLNQPVQQDVSRGTPLSWALLETQFVEPSR